MTANLLSRLSAALVASAALINPVLAAPATGLPELSASDTFRLPSMATRALDVKPGQPEAGTPYVFAEAIETSLEPEVIGSWEYNADGTAVYRLAIEAPGALSLNLGFTDFHLPDGAEMYLYNNPKGGWHGPFGTEYNRKHREFWTPVVQGERMVVEVQVPPGSEGDLALEVGFINRGFRPFGVVKNEENTGTEKSGSCNVDVACPDGNPWSDEIRSVANTSVRGVFGCTGVLVNNTAQDRRQLFLTADHCGINANDAPTMVFYWNYDNSTCRTPGSSQSGQEGDGSLAQYSLGSVLLSDYDPSDFTLLEITDPIPAEYGVFFSGWDARSLTPAATVSIHHPSNDEKRISFDNDPAQLSPWLETPSVPDTHLRVVWDVGTTEPGSSGSPLYDASTRRIIGQLHGGTASCSLPNDPDFYGRLFRSWTGGGTSSSRLRDWLDPLNSGAEFVDGLDDRLLTVSNVEVVGGEIVPGGNGAFRLTLENQTDTASGAPTTASILTSPPGTAPLTGTTSFLLVPAGGSATGLNALSFSMDGSISAGDVLTFEVLVESPIQPDLIVPVTLPVGVPGQEQTLSAPLASGFPTLDLERQTATINVPQQGVITDVDLTLNIDHTYVADLRVRLTSPDGTMIELMRARGGSANNVDRLVLDDEAAQGLGSGIPPYQGNFRPDHPLSGFDGLPMQGDWTLEVSDYFPQDSGQVRTASTTTPSVVTGLTITYRPLGGAQAGMDWMMIR